MSNGEMMLIIQDAWQLTAIISMRKHAVIKLRSSIGQLIITDPLPSKKTSLINNTHVNNNNNFLLQTDKQRDYVAN